MFNPTTSQLQAKWFARYSAALAPRPAPVLYAEASYFDGYHFAHIAQWEEAKRCKRIRTVAHRALGVR